MPTFHSLLPPTGNSTDLATYVTDTIDPLPNRLILVSINCYIAAGAVQPPTPTVTGNGITYTLEKSQPIDATGADQSTLFVFRGMSSAPTKGAITIAFGSVMGNCAWNVDQSSADVDTTGTNGSGAIAQTSVGATSATTVTASPTTTFGTAMTAGNAAYFVCGIETNGPQTPRAGWIETGDSSATSLVGIEAQYINGTDTDGSSTWSTAARAGTVLLEIKAGATSPNGLVAARASSATGSVNTLPGVRHPTPILNDIEILASASDATQTLAIDALFTQQLSLVDGSLRAYLGSNVSDGSEVGDISISSTATANRQVGCVAVFRGYSGVEASNLQSLAEAGTDNSHDSPSITPVYTGSCIVFVYYERVSTGTVSPQTPPSPLTTAVEFGTGLTGGTYVQIAYQSSGVVAGTPVSPGPWTGAGFVATGSAYVLALELIPSATGTTGTVAVTQAGDVASASGALGYTGASAATQAANTSAATGSVAGPVTGAAAASQANQTANASGKLGYSGTSTASQAANTASAVGKLLYSGTSAATQANQTATATGKLGYTATAAPAQAANIATATGTVAAGGVIVGTAAPVQAAQTSIAAGILGYTGTAAASQANQTASASGKLGYSATAATSQAANTAAGSGVVTAGVTGSAATTQANQTATAVGILRYTATGTTTQAGNTAAASGVFFITITGTASVVQANQTAAASGTALKHIVTRPDDGVTPRPYAGGVTRPAGGTTTRPSGVTPRPYAGTTTRP